jgi:hypothetical protein
MFFSSSCSIQSYASTQIRTNDHKALNQNDVLFLDAVTHINFILKPNFLDEEKTPY